MKRLQCIGGCGGLPSYQSVRWPRVIICQPCARLVLQWLAENDVVVGNPLAHELMVGVAEYFPARGYRIWVPSEFESGAWSELWLLETHSRSDENST